MSETEPSPQHELTDADTRDLQTFPFKITWDIPSTQENIKTYIAQFGNLVEGEISESWLTDSDIFELNLCFNEVLVNAVKHGNEFDPEKNVHVEIRMNDQEFKVSVQDVSPVQFDPASVPDPRANENLLKTSGRGTFFMDNFFGIGKNATFEFLNPGNKITLTRHRESQMS